MTYLDTKQNAVIFKDNKSLRSHKTAQIEGFLNFFA